MADSRYCSIVDCALCRKLPLKLDLDLELVEEIPKELKKLSTVLSFDRTYAVGRVVRAGLLVELSVLNGLQKFRILPDKRKREGLETAATQLAEKTYLNCVTPNLI